MQFLLFPACSQERRKTFNFNSQLQIRIIALALAQPWP
jgi:hypothetical protein